jgi:hypothetical protein
MIGTGITYLTVAENPNSERYEEIVMSWRYLKDSFDGGLAKNLQCRRCLQLFTG